MRPLEAHRRPIRRSTCCAGPGRSAGTGPGSRCPFWAARSLRWRLPLVAALSLGAGPAGVSAVATAAMLPNLLFSLLVGNWVEGRDHRRIMVPADLVRALLIAVIPVAWLAGALSLPLLVVVAFLDRGGRHLLRDLRLRVRAVAGPRPRAGRGQPGGPGLEHGDRGRRAGPGRPAGPGGRPAAGHGRRRAVLPGQRASACCSADGRPTASRGRPAAMPRRKPSSRPAWPRA